MLSRMQKFIQSLIDFTKKAKAVVTWPVFGSFLLMALPLALLFAILFDIFLYALDPMRLPLFIVRLGGITVLLLGLLVTLIVVLVASQPFRRFIKELNSFVQNSLQTPRLKKTIYIASILASLLYPCVQATTAYSSPPRTTIPNTPYSGTVVVSDPLIANRLGWVAIPPQKNSCAFTDSGYEVRAGNVNKNQTCLADKTNFSDFALQIEMTLKTGIVGGIWFRNQYLLELAGNPYSYGYFNLYAFTQNIYLTSLLPRCDPTQTGCPIGENFAPQQTITITVVARGNSIELYFDTYRMRTITNGVSSTGSIGVFAQKENGQQDAQTDVLFANMRIWTDIA